MSKSKNYEPGTVAMLSWPGTARHYRAGQRIMAVLTDHDDWACRDGGAHHVTSTIASDQRVRPLAVIDPAVVEPFAAVLRRHIGDGPMTDEHITAAARELADPTSPVEEPTLPEAKVRDAKGRVWDLKSPDDPFGQWLHIADEANLWRAWFQIPQPVEVLFEGVKPCACGKPDAYALTPGERIDHGPDACRVMVIEQPATREGGC